MLRHAAQAAVVPVILGLAGCVPGQSATPTDVVGCIDVGQGTTHVLDWSPDGAWLALIRSNQDHTATVMRLGASRQPEVVASGEDIVDFAVAVDDEGRVYFERAGPPPVLVRSTPGASSSWPTPLLVALERTPGHLLALKLLPGRDWDAGTLLELGLGEGLSTETLGEWPGAVGLAAEDDLAVVGIQPVVGGPVTFTQVASPSVSMTIQADALPSPIGLVSTPSDWLVLYLKGSNSASIASATRTGATGPTIDAGHPIVTFDVSPAGRYATSSFNGPADQSRVCFGSLRWP
jgi:hypothetical protein